MDAWSEVGPVSNLNLNGTKKGKGKKKNHIFFPIFVGADSGHELEREMREIPPSLYDLRRSGGRNPLSQDLNSSTR